MLSRPGLYVPSGLFSTEHIVAFLICLAIVVICLYLINDFTAKDLDSLIVSIGAAISLLVFIEFMWDIYIGISFNESVTSLIIPLVFITSLWLTRVKNKKTSQIAKTFMAYFGITFGLMLIIFTVPSFTNYPLFHIKCLFSLFNYSAMLFCGLSLVKKGEIKINLKSLKHTLIIMLNILVDCLLINLIFNVNFLYLISPDSLNIGALNNLYLFSSEIYTLIIFATYLVAFVVVFILSKLYSLLKKKYEK